MRIRGGATASSLSSSSQVKMCGFLLSPLSFRKNFDKSNGLRAIYRSCSACFRKLRQESQVSIKSGWLDSILTPGDLELLDPGSQYMSQLRFFTEK
jgi:hypothetical protein